MSAAAIPYATSDRGWTTRLLRAGLIMGVADGLWAMGLALWNNRPAMRVWQTVASVPFGKSMYDGGTPTQLLGLAMHFGVAFAWSGLFLLLVLRSPWLRGILDSPYGVLKVAAVYGPLVWMVMSVVVIPLLVQRPVVITSAWWIQLPGHLLFVGIPIAASIGSGSR